MTAFNIVVSLVTVGAALVTVGLVSLAGKASATATSWARDSVAIAIEARAASEYWRQLQQLQQIAQLVEHIRQAAEQAAISDSQADREDWRRPDQDLLEIALIGAGLELPKCHALVQAGKAAMVAAAAREAVEELETAAHKAEQEQGLERWRRMTWVTHGGLLPAAESREEHGGRSSAGRLRRLLSRVAAPISHDAAPTGGTGASE
jgi:hypothetical protein